MVECGQIYLVTLQYLKLIRKIFSVLCNNNLELFGSLSNKSYWSFVLKIKFRSVSDKGLKYHSCILVGGLKIKDMHIPGSIC